MDAQLLTVFDVSRMTGIPAWRVRHLRRIYQDELKPDRTIGTSYLWRPEIIEQFRTLNKTLRKRGN